MNVGFVDPENLTYWWPQAKPLVNRALEQGVGEQTADDVLERLLEGEQVLVIGTQDGTTPSMAAVVGVVYYPQFRALRVVLAAGEPMSEWIAPLVSTLEGACATMDAEQVEFFGRPGFSRALAEWADHAYTVMVRKVPDERRQRDDDHHREHARAVGSGG